MKQEFIVKSIICDKLRIPQSKINDSDNLELVTDGNSAVANEIMGILIEELQLSDSESSSFASMRFKDMNKNIVIGSYTGKIIKKIEVAYSNINFTQFGDSEKELQLLLNNSNIERTQSEVDQFAAKHNIISTRKVSDHESGNNSPATVVSGTDKSQISTEEFKKYLQSQRNICDDFLNSDNATIDSNKLVSDDATPTFLKEELGSDFIDGIEPIFYTE